MGMVKEITLPSQVVTKYHKITKMEIFNEAAAPTVVALIGMYVSKEARDANATPAHLQRIAIVREGVFSFGQVYAALTELPKYQPVLYPQVDAQGNQIIAEDGNPLTVTYNLPTNHIDGNLFQGAEQD
jgi:hypothetical protein